MTDCICVGNIEVYAHRGVSAVDSRLRLLKDAPTKQMQTIARLQQMHNRLEGMVMYSFDYKSFKDDADLDALTSHPLT